MFLGFILTLNYTLPSEAMKTIWESGGKFHILWRIVYQD